MSRFKKGDYVEYINWQASVFNGIYQVDEWEDTGFISLLPVKGSHYSEEVMNAFRSKGSINLTQQFIFPADTKSIKVAIIERNLSRLQDKTSSHQ